MLGLAELCAHHYQRMVCPFPISEAITSLNRMGITQQPQQRVVGSIADYDPLNGSWGTAAQSKTNEANSSETRYCLDFTESGRNAASDKDEVSFLEGDVIVNCEKVDDGWMTGTVQRTLQWGMLPANYVQPYKLPTGLARINIMSSFDDEERRAKYAVAPKSANHGKVVKLSPKKLHTQREVRTVLPEEQYLAKLEKIIVRDYFPDLPKLKAQTEYMDAMKRNDIAKMRVNFSYVTTLVVERIDATMAATSPGHQARAPTSPANFDPDTPGPSRPPDSLQATPLPYANREGDNEVLKEGAKKEKAATDELSVDAYMNKFTSEDNASFEELAAVELAKERAKKGWIDEAERKHNAKMITYGELPASADLQLAIKYDPEFDKGSARASNMQAANNAGKVDAQGHEVGLNSKTLGLVATPSPAPGIDDSPLMTWGEIDGTPFRLDASDIPSTDRKWPYMPEVPFREQVAQGITDTIAKRLSRTPRFGSARSSTLSMATLSPAARRLASNKLGIRLPSSAHHLRVLTPTSVGSSTN
ncbi:SH3 domain protein [Ostertagia ostertagi]